MHVRDIMTSPVVTVAPDTPLKTVAELLVEHRISAVPVVDSTGALVGIISEGDLIHRQETRTQRRHSWWLNLFGSDELRALEFVKSHGRFAREVMSRHVLTVDAWATLSALARLFDKGGVKRLPVMADGKLAGIVSRLDLVRALARATSNEDAAASRPDAEIQLDLEAAVKNESWASALTLVFGVHGGIIQLMGFVRSESERQALIVLAENIPGVTRVEDHLQMRNFTDV